MPFNLLIFPLVGGYFILVRLQYIKYIQYRLESQRVLLNSALLGIFLLLITFVVRIITNAIFPDLISAVYSHLPIKTPFFGTTGFSLIIAVAGTETANLFIKRKKAIQYSIEFVGNEFELLLKSSFINSRLLQFSLNNDKFYIGWLKELPKPFSGYVRITPAFSGYRDEKKELMFTTQYLSVYSSYIEEGLVTDIKELDTDLILKVDTIITVSYFDIEMYNRFNPYKVET